MRTSRWIRLLPVVLGTLLVAQAAAVAAERPDDGAAVRGAASAAAATTGATGLESSSPTAFDPGGLAEQLIEGTPLGQLAPTSKVRGPRCGTADRPETGLQGDVPLVDQLSGRAAEGYSCGIDVIGYNALGARGANGNMAWAGHCAFVAGDGIAVVDVADPTRPRHVRTLTTPGALDTLETLAAGTHAGRSILVAGRYGLFLDFQLASAVPVDVYDVTDCAAPKLLSTIQMPTSVHNLTLSSDLTRMWSTLPLQAVDLTDPTRPKYLGNIESQLQAAGVFHLEYSHEVTLSPDGDTLFLGGQIAGDEGSMIVDVTDWPARPPKVVADYSGPGHSIDLATIGGTPYLLRSEESVVPPLANSCVPGVLTPFGGVAEAFLTNLADETTPVDRGTLSLEINRPEHCASALVSGVATSSHYHDVDDPTDTTFAMVSMWNAGLRIFDVRDPDAPREVAYLNPGQFGPTQGTNGPTPLDNALNTINRTSLDITWAHVRYQPENGQIWLTTRTGGFWVLQLQPQVRKQLDLPALPVVAPLPGSPRPVASRHLRPPPAFALPAGTYCTLSKMGSLG